MIVEDIKFERYGRVMGVVRRPDSQACKGTAILHTMSAQLCCTNLVMTYQAYLLRLAQENRTGSRPPPPMPHLTKLPSRRIKI